MISRLPPSIKQSSKKTKSARERGERRQCERNRRHVFQKKELHRCGGARQSLGWNLAQGNAVVNLQDAGRAGRVQRVRVLWVDEEAGAANARSRRRKRGIHALGSAASAGLKGAEACSMCKN